MKEISWRFLFLLMFPFDKENGPKLILYFSNKRKKKKQIEKRSIKEIERRLRSKFISLNCVLHAQIATTTTKTNFISLKWWNEIIFWHRITKCYMECMMFHHFKRWSMSIISKSFFHCVARYTWHLIARTLITKKFPVIFHSIPKREKL